MKKTYYLNTLAAMAFCFLISLNAFSGDGQCPSPSPPPLASIEATVGASKLEKAPDQNSNSNLNNELVFFAKHMLLSISNFI